MVVRTAVFLFCFVLHRKEKKNILCAVNLLSLYCSMDEGQFYLYPISTLSPAIPCSLFFSPSFLNYEANLLPLTRQSLCPDPTIVLSVSPVADTVD